MKSVIQVSAKVHTKHESRWIDYALIGIMSCLAIYAMGQATNAFRAFLFLSGVALVGIVFSYSIMRWVKNAAFLRLDSLVLVSATGISVAFQGNLNAMLPGQPFPKELWACGFLCWTLALCCFGLWRDQSKLFVVIPSIALFGLIGVYDTYRLAVFLFFIFLLCLALLFGRIHARSMLRLAFSSGYRSIESGVELNEESVEMDSIFRAMRRGAWKWMAGPEWALGSAAVVIGLSVLGAPMIKNSVRQIAGRVVVPVSKSIIKNSQALTQMPLTSQASVGNGPVLLSNRVDGLVSMDKPRYVMVKTYSFMNGSSWSTNDLHQMESFQNPEFFNSNHQSLTPRYQALINQIEEPQQIHFAVRMLEGNIGALPVPEAVTKVLSPSGIVIGQDGRLLNMIRLYSEGSVSGYFTTSKVRPGDPNHPEVLKAFPTSGPADSDPKVVALTKQIIQGKKTDWEKAIAIELAIDSRCKYNLDAPAVPVNVDPVEYFLFQSKQGYCDLFASAMAEMSKIAGIDARYAIGYLTESNDRDSHGNYVLRENHMHAWAELKFHGLGWVPFDATSGAIDITPQGDSNLAQTHTLWIELAAGFLSLLAALYVVLKRPVLKVVLPTWMLPRQQRSKTIDLYLKFNRDLERISGMHRPESMGPTEWLAAVKGKLGTSSELATQINDQFVGCLYGPPDQTGQVLKNLTKEVARFHRFK